MVADMRVRIEAGRALAYETARVCDFENNYNRLLERNADALSDDEKKSFRQKARNLKKLNAMLTPMSKYFCSEKCETDYWKMVYAYMENERVRDLTESYGKRMK